MILSGMVKNAVVLRNHVVGFLVFLGFIRLWDTLPLTIIIEMRLCCDESSSNEDVPFSIIVEVFIN